MWKRILISLITIIGTFSVVFAMNQGLFASPSISYQSGGSVTGRINMPPSGISGSNFGMQKGDKIMMGAINPSTGNPLSWQLLETHTYTDYGCANNAITALDAVLNAQINVCSNTPITAWKSIATEKIGTVAMGFENNDFIRYCNLGSGFGDSCVNDLASQSTAPSYYASDNVFQVINQLYTALNSKDKSIIEYYDLTQQRAATVASAFDGQTPDTVLYSAFSIINSIFFTNHADVYQMIMPYLPIAESGVPIHSMNPNFDNRNYKFNENYLIGYSYTSPAFPAAQGVINGISGNFNVVDDGVDLSSSGAIRPLTYLNTENIVFGLSTGTSDSQGYAAVDDTAIPSAYTDLYKIGGEPMKVRVLNTSLTATFNSIQNKKNVGITQVGKNAKAYINANANGGGDAINGYHTVSVLVFNEANQLVYYRPLTKANGQANYEWDTTGLLAGNYKVAIVNEVFDATSTSPADSSAISSVKNIEIVEPLSNLVYEPITTEATYGSANTKGGQAIGTIGSKNGVAVPTYTVIEDPSYPGQANDFEMGSVNANHQANVLIKGKTTDSLKVGTYHFLVQATDANGDPDPALTVPCTITVKPQASTLKFNQTGTQEMKIGGSVFTGTISYSNTDSNFTPKLELDAAAKGLLTVTLSADKKTYTVTPASTYTGTQLPKNFTLTLSGNATTNYSAPKSVTKTFTLYKELSGLKWTGWSEGQVNYPIDTVSSANIAIGTLVAVDGYPNFTYSITSSTDNMFKLAKTTGAVNEKINVQTTGKLSAKTYTINFKVVDQKGVSKTVNATINVTLNAQAKLYFVNSGGTDITGTGQSVAYGNKTQKLLTKGGSSSKAVTYALAPAANQPSGIGSTASDYVTIGTDGTITPKKIGTVKVMATKPADDTYSAISTQMNLTITAGGQSIAWNGFPNPAYHVFEKDKTFTVSAAALTRDDKTTGTITYGTTTPTICSVSNTTITMKAVGTCTITASNKDANYKEANKSVDISLYTGISGNFTSVKVNQGSNEAKGGSTTSLAAITLSGGDGTYTKTAFKVTKDRVDMTSSFSLSGSAKVWKLTPAKDLKYGAYAVSVTFTDGHGGSKEVTGTITIGLQTNTSFKLVDHAGTAIPNNLISKTYTNGLNFKVMTTGGLGSGTIQYKLSDDSTKTDPAISINETTGQIDVKRVTKDSETYKVYAYIAEDQANGYAAQTTQEVTIKITNGVQSIAFQNPPTHKVFKENTTFTINAALTRDDKTTGTITYSSATPTICTIVDNTVTMKAKGKCTITAKNEDENYEAAVKNVDIDLYTGITGTITSVNVNQGSDQAKAGSTTSIANITLSGGDGTYTKSAFKVTKDHVDMTSSFSLSGSAKAWKITPAKALTYGSYAVSITYIDGNGGTSVITGTITVGLQTNTSFKLVDSSGTAIPQNVITKAYTKGLNFKVMTTGGLGSGAIQYKLSDDSTKTDPALSINETTGQIDVKRVTKDNETYKVYAYIAEDQANGYAAQTTQEVTIKITNGVQSIAFQNPPTHKVFKENTTFTINAALTRDDKTTGTITYSSATPTICTIVDNTVTMKAKGKCTITAKNEDVNYEAAVKNVDIDLYTGITGTITSVNVNQGSDQAKAGSTTSLAGIALTGGDGTYTKTAFKVTKDRVDMTDSFALSGSGKTWNITPAKDLTYGAYAVSITYTDGNGGTGVIAGTITIGLETNSNFKLVDHAGADILNNIITKAYANDLSFHVLATGELGTGTILYKMSDDSTKDDPAVTIEETTGLIKVTRPMKDGEVYKVYATIEEDQSKGYAAQKTQEVTIKITNGEQSIAFDSTIPEYVTYTENKEIAVPAILTRSDGTSGTIKYTSTTTDVCTIADETVAKVTLIKDANGTCKITASNSDENYGDVEDRVSIGIYASIKGTFNQKQKPLKQGEEAVKKGKNIANINPISGGDGTYSYNEIVVKKEGQDVSNIFVMDTKTGEITLNKDLTYGDYNIIVTVSDEHEGLVNISYTMSVGLQTNSDFRLTYDGKAPSNDTITVDYHSVKDQGIGISTVGKLGNGTIHYTMSDDTTKNDPAVEIEDETAGTIKVNRATKAGEAYKVYAYVEEDSALGYAKQTTKEITIIVKQSEQVIAFADPSDTEHALNGTAFSEVAAAKLKGQEVAGVGNITYSSDNEDVVKINPNTGAITMLKAGEANITATIHDDQGNYADANTKKKVIVHDGIVVDFTAKTPHIQASDTAKDTNIVVGTLSTSGGGNKTPSYQSSSEDVIENKDKDLFVIDSNTGAVKLKNTITPAQLNAHGKEYKIRCNITVGSDTITKDIVIEIDPALQDAYYIDGDGKKLISIVEPYKKDGTFQVAVNKKGSGSVTYQLKDTSSKNVIEVDDQETKLIHILKATNPDAPEEVILVATIEEKDGYAETVIEIPVTITLAKQSISFEEAGNVSIEFVENEVYESPAILYEADQSVSNRLIKYSSEDEGICEIDEAGSVLMHKAGTCKIKAMNHDTNYEKVETKTKTITIYQGMTTVFTQNEGEKPQAGTASTHADVPVGTVKTEGGIPDITYHVSEEVSDDNAQSSYFDVTDRGIVVLTKQIEASDLAGLPVNEDGYYVMKVVLVGMDQQGHKKAGKAEILIRGAEPDIEVKGTDAYGELVKTYVPDGTFTIRTSNSGNAIAEYRLATTDGNPQDVITVSESGTSTMLNACEGSDMVDVEVKIPAKNGYDAATKNIKVKINQAEQSDFAFHKKIIQLQEESSIDPVISGIMAKENDGSLKKWIMISDDESIVEIAGTSIKAVGKAEEETTVTASVDGDRNYLPAIAKVKVIITQKQTDQFLIQVPKATYGDDDSHLYANVIIDTGTGANKKQEWISENPEIAEVDKETGKLTIKKAGKTKITCTQTSDGTASVSASAVFNIAPKQLIVQIDDQTKKYGQELPDFTIQEVQGLVGKDTIKEPAYECLDGSKQVNADTKPGIYPINGTYDTDAYPNYQITVKPGKLTIIQDVSKPIWFELIGKDTGESGTKTTWFKEAVKVKLGKVEAGGYDAISIDEQNWYQEYVLVENEGNNEVDVYFKQTATDARSTAQKTNVRIDLTPPQIKRMSGTMIKQNALEKALNALTFDTMFKPNDLFTIEVEDVQKEHVNEISGVDKIKYQSYRIDPKTQELSKQPYAQDTIKVKDHKAQFRLTNPGKYRICATAIDVAGNESKPSCSDLHIKRINVDVDGDGEDDFNDSNNPGCPDLNIKWKEQNEKGDIIDHLINIDRDHDAIPDLNIDSDGDGKPDLNIDTDHDGKPDLNLVILSKKDSQETPSVWNPTQCANSNIIDMNGELVEYCTGTSVKPQINVDTNGDGIPDINIDNKGDFKAHINVTKDGSTKPYLNVILDDQLVWKPDHDASSKGFVYDTMTLKPEYNIDTNQDGLPDVNIDTNGANGGQKPDGLPDLNIDINGDFLPDTNIDGDGDGKADYNLDDGTGTPIRNVITISTWEPTTKGNVNGIEFGTMELHTIPELEDQGVIIQNANKEQFTPNYALHVEDVTKEKADSLLHEILNDSEDKKIAQVYKVSLLKNGIKVDADNQLTIRIPAIKGLKNPSLLIQLKDGTYKAIVAKEQDGYYSYQSDFLGIVAILEDVEESSSSKVPAEKPDQPKPSKLPDENSGGAIQKVPNESVKGAYESGVNSGDYTSYLQLFVMMLGSVTTVFILLKTRRKHK